MGYYAKLIDSKFHIAKDQQGPCLKAMKQMMGPEYDSQKSGGSWSDGRRQKACYAWVDTEEVLKARTLDKALLEWGYVVWRDGQGNITSIRQKNGETKLGDEDALFKAIDPYVTQGSYVRFRGEDDEVFGWELGEQPVVKPKDKVSKAVPQRKIAWT